MFEAALHLGWLIIREHLTCLQIVEIHWTDNRENLIYTSDFCFLDAEGQNWAVVQ